MITENRSRFPKPKCQNYNFETNEKDFHHSNNRFICLLLNKSRANERKTIYHHR